MDVIEKTSVRDVSSLYPLIVLLAVLAVFGIIGNILTIIFFARIKPSSTVSLVTFMGIVDMFVCFMIIPQFIEILFLTTHTEPWLCKLSHFLDMWFITWSCLILWLIAIDRYRKVVEPFQDQVSIRETKLAFAAFAIFSCCLSARTFIIVDSVPVAIKESDSSPPVTGYYCTTSDSKDLRTSILVFHTVDVASMLFAWLTIILMYSKILFTLSKLQKKRRTDQKRNQSTANSSYNIESLNLMVEEPTTLYKGWRRDTANDSIELLSFKNRQSETSESDIGESSFGYVDVRVDKMPNQRMCLRNATSRIRKRVKLRKRNDYNYTDCKQRLRRSFSDSELFTIEVSRSKKKLQCKFSMNPESVRREFNANEDSIVSKNLSTIQEAETTTPEDNLRKRRRTRRRAKSGKERRITIMMFTISLIFIACFAPYFIVKFLRLLFSTGPEFELDTWVQVGIRLVYLNSSLNPLIYIIVNREFRLFLLCKGGNSIRKISSLYPKSNMVF